MRARMLIGAMGGLSLAACNNSEPQQNYTSIKVRSAEQDQLKTLDALNLAIALKRAIYDAGYTCKRVTDGGFAGEWKNLDMWVAHCVYDTGQPRDWAIFTGPDGSAQVRDCKDIPGSGLPECKIQKRPAGSFTELKTSSGKKAE
jgi:hypothetical protein